MHITVPYFKISPYPFFVIGASLLGMFIAYILMRKQKVSQLTSLLTVGLCSVIAASCSVMTSQILTSKCSFSGFGAALGLFIGIMISNKIHNEKSECVYASFITAMPLMYGISKIGCLLAGCCTGRIYYGTFAVFYKWRNMMYFPSQIVESIVFISMHFVALYILRKEDDPRITSYCTLALAFIARFGLDFLRASHADKIITSDQILTLIGGVGALIIIFIRRKKYGIKTA